MLPGRNYTPEDILRIVWYRKWIIIAGAVVSTCVAVFAAMRIPDVYKSETLIMVIPQRIPESYVRSTITTRIEERLRSISPQILSRSRLERVITEFSLYAEARKSRPIEQIVEQMRANVDIDTVRDDAFKVSFTSHSPRTAMIVTERLASMFIAENLRDREVMAEGTNQFLETQLENARGRLIDHEKKLEAYRRRYSGELPSQVQTNLQVIQGAQNQIQNLAESVNRDRDRRLLLEKSVTEVPASSAAAPAAPDTRGGPVDAPAIGDGSTIDQLDKAQNDLRALELRFKPEHPDIVAKKRVIAGLERKVQQEASSSPQSTTAPGKPMSGAEMVRRTRARQDQVEIDKIDRQIGAKEAEMERLRRMISDYQTRVDAVPGHESELTELMRDYDTLQKIYTSLLAKKEDSKISANLEREQVGEQFKILDPARLPEKPYSPNRPRIILLGAALGLGFAIGLAGFLEYRDSSLRTEDEIVRTLVLPVIAAIPIMTAVADVRRRRRMRIILSAAGALVVALGVAAVALWRGGLLKDIV